jgi:hypothetical protein
LRVLRQILQGDLGLALAYHEMHNDHALEDNGPCRVAQAVREGSEDFCDAGFTRVRRDQDMLDILGFRGGQLVCKLVCGGARQDSECRQGG